MLAPIPFEADKGAGLDQRNQCRQHVLFAEFASAGAAQQFTDLARLLQPAEDHAHCGRRGNNQYVGAGPGQQDYRRRNDTGYFALDSRSRVGPDHARSRMARQAQRQELNLTDPCELAEIESATPTVLASVNFNEGHRYADFDPSVDKVAAYGIGALIAGGVAAKAGLFKGLLAVLIAGKKLVIVGVAAIGGLISRMVRGPKQDAQA